MQAGRCLALQYGCRKQMMDLSEGIRVEFLDGVFVFRAPFEKLRKVSDKLCSSGPVCFHQGCDSRAIKGALMRCARCKSAQYCCKVLFWPL
jgi:hypothetical protein